MTSMTVKQMPTTEVRTQVRQFVVDSFLFGQNGQTLNDDDSFLDLGIVDSTGVLELVGFLETQFHVSVANDELIPDNLDSVSKVATFVSSKLRLNAAHS
jgi:acyl carrier protein